MFSVPKFMNPSDKEPLPVATFVGVAVQDELMDPAIAVLDLSVAIDLPGCMICIDKIDRMGTDVQHRNSDRAE